MGFYLNRCTSFFQQHGFSCMPSLITDEKNLMYWTQRLYHKSTGQTAQHVKEKLTAVLLQHGLQ